MGIIDLSGLTDAQLTTMQTNLINAHARTLNSKEYKIGSREIRREAGKDILEQLSAVNMEIALRADTTAGSGVVEFGEPE